MTERKEQTTESETTVSQTSGSELIRDVDPNDPEHRDAGQIIADDREKLNKEERERQERAREEEKSA